MLFFAAAFLRSPLFSGVANFVARGGKKQAIAEIPAQTVGLVTCLVRLGGELEPKRVNPIFSLPFLYSTLPISISSIFALTLPPFRPVEILVVGILEFSLFSPSKECPLSFCPA